jgi:hypothetical protein
MFVCSLQVRAVPIRKDDEVQIVRGTFKVRHCGSCTGHESKC